MKKFLHVVLSVNSWMQVLAGISLTLIVIVTTVDVIARLFGNPVPGAVEVIAILGGIAVGFTLPMTSWMKGHVAVEVVLNSFRPRVRNGVYIVTRAIAIFLCLLISRNFLSIGTDFWQKGEVSGTLTLPLFPVCYGLMACFIVLSIVFLCDIIILFWRSDENE